MGLVVESRLALKTTGTVGLALLSLLLGCGGGGSAATAAEPATAHSKKSASARNESSSAAEQDEEDDTAPAAPCADGTCTTCGKGICPVGFYCDESAKGGAACSWLPQCGEKLSCSCLSKGLGSGCKCSEQSGGLHVSCN